MLPNRAAGVQHARSRPSNLQTFLLSTCPAVPIVRQAQDNSAAHFQLADLWGAYEEWSAYGAEVSLRLPNALVTQCYVPYLSAIQVFEAAPPSTRAKLHSRSPPASCPPTAAESAQEPCSLRTQLSAASRSELPDSEGPAVAAGTFKAAQPAAREPPVGVSTAYSSDEDCADPLSSDASSSSSGSSSICTDSDGEEFSSKGGQEHLHTCTQRQDRGSVLVKQGSLGEPRRCLFEFFETVSPHNRQPLTSRVQFLAEGNGVASFPGLLSLRSCDVHPASWYAVAWYPIYHLPHSKACSARAHRDLSACFLTLHSLATPAHLASGAVPPLGQPQPPQLPLATQAAYEKRRTEEVARNGGQEITFLEPFAFVPYKLQGRVWVDESNAASVHGPMMAAATAWVAQRRRVHHPDMDFFMQRGACLPSSRR